MVVMVMVVVPVRAGSVTTPRVKHVQYQRRAERQPRTRRLMATVRQFDQQRGDRRVCVAGRFDRQRPDVAETGHLAVVGIRLLLGRAAIQYDGHERERSLGHVQHLHDLLATGSPHVGCLTGEQIKKIHLKKIHIKLPNI